MNGEVSRKDKGKTLERAYVSAEPLARSIAHLVKELQKNGFSREEAILIMIKLTKPKS